jgi:hypothetical protein
VSYHMRRSQRTTNHPPSFRSIYHSTPLKSPTITAYALKWTPNTTGDLKEHAGSVKGVLKTPEAKKN